MRLPATIDRHRERASQTPWPSGFAKGGARDPVFLSASEGLPVTTPSNVSAAPPSDRPAPPLVGIVMGSRSDWATLERASQVLTQFGIPHECEIVSAHRTPGKLADYAATAAGRGIRLIIAGAGGAAHLPGMMAAQTALPVLGVPVESAILQGVDSLLSIVQMPAGIPVGTLAIGPAGATNAALFAVAVLALGDPALAETLRVYREAQTQRVLADQITCPGKA
jgi:5-(carboxyamino)imidazole ribonucleotide mutase